MKIYQIDILNFLKEYFATDFQMIFVKKGVFNIISQDVPYRLDVGYSRTVLELQYKMLKNGVNVPKVLATKVCKGTIFKLSEWINGCLLRNTNSLKVYSLLGEQVAKLNLIKISDKHFIGCSDINSSGVVYDGTNVYLIDLDSCKPKENPDKTVVQILLKRIKVKGRIEAFLQGYSRYRSITNIRTLCEERQWRWRTK